MKKLLILTLFFIIGFLQNNILSLFPIFGILPNIILVLGLILILLGYEKEGVVFCFGQGLWLDLASFHFFGINTFLILLALNLFLLFKKLLVRKFFVSFLITMLLSTLIRLAVSFPEVDFLISFKGGLIDGGLFILLFYPIAKLSKHFFYQKILQLDFKDYL